MSRITHITLGMVQDLYTPIKTEAEGEINCHQVVMSLRSRVCYSCTIFQAVNKNKATGDTVAICHSEYKEEANEIIVNLAALSIERFGQKAKR